MLAIQSSLKSDLHRGWLRCVFLLAFAEDPLQLAVIAVRKLTEDGAATRQLATVSKSMIDLLSAALKNDQLAALSSRRSSASAAYATVLCLQEGTVLDRVISEDE